MSSFADQGQAGSTQRKPDGGQVADVHEGRLSGGGILDGMNELSRPTLFRPGVGSRGMTELHYAAYRGDQSALARQLDAGADPNGKDQYRGYAAVHWLADMAATGGPRVQMLRLLVQHGANLDALADNGASALSLATETGSAAGEQLVQEINALRSRASS
jgi:hypothetical protein